MEQGIQFLETIVKAIVEKPEAVKITSQVDQMGTLLILSVDSVDMGKVIGKVGITAQAIRTLLRVIGMKYNARINLKILEPSVNAKNTGKQGFTAPEDIDKELEDL